MSSGKELETPAAQAQEFIPEAVGAVMALFEGPLKGVIFPGIDRDRLGKRVKEVETAFLALADVQARVDGLRMELHAAKERLLKDAERALAYARVYAGDDNDLHESLSQIEFASPEAEKRRKARKTANGEAGPGQEAVAENGATTKSGEEVRAPKRRAKAADTDAST